MPARWSAASRLSASDRGPGSVTLVLNPPTTVAVIGAGLAGLTAAHRLRLAGADVVVYEARERIGGRVQTVSDGFKMGQCGDLGPELVTPGCTALPQLCMELGVELSEPVVYGGDDAASGETTLEALLEAGRLVVDGERLDDAAFEAVDREIRSALRSTPAAPHEVLAQWARRARLSHSARAALAGIARMVTQADVGQLDGRYVFAHQLGGGRRVVGGTGQLAAALARGLELRLGTPVRTLRQGGGRVLVTTEKGETWRFDRAVVTAPSHVLATIGFDPPLEPQRLAALNAFQPAVGGKVVAQYAQGDAVRAALTQPCFTDSAISALWVANPHVSEGPAVVSGLACGSDRALLESPDAALELLDQLVALTVRGPVVRLAGLTKDWTADRWALGVTTTPGESQRGELLARVARPENRIHLAGDYTDFSWCGTMEGAVRSGQRAADEILRRATRIPLPEIDARLVRG
jgi:monoamine oxidase